MTKQIAYIGLGKMGKNMVLRLLEKGWDVHAYNRSDKAYAEIEQAGAKTYAVIHSLISAVQKPLLVWVMVAHDAVDDMLGQVVPELVENDTIIDGGNSFYREALIRSTELKVN